MSPDDVHIEYTIHGTGDPVLVLVHDWACSASYWRSQVEALSGTYTVVALNLGGHGASGRNRTNWTLDAYAQDVATVVRQLPGRPIVLVGHSMGGVVALGAAPLIGERLLGIIAVDSLQSLGSPPPSRFAIDQQIAPFRESFVGAARALAPRLFPRGADPKLVARVAYDMSLAPPQVAISSRIAWLSWNPGTSLTQLHVPVLAIISDLTPTDVARIRRYLPGFQADVLPHTGHFLMMEVPEQFNAVLVKDVEQLARRARTPHP
jgi:pimeloyl-ACP methyl ester carboxylesterase